MKMCSKKSNLTLLLLLILVHNAKEYRFMRRIIAIGYPYYKILMKLGTCKEKVLYYDQKIWGQIALNRVLDIYYKCDNQVYKVSRVEIKLVINNTSSFAYSEAGVGDSEFSATLYLPANLNFVLYALTIFTCNSDRELDPEQSFRTKEDTYKPQSYMPFLRSNRN